MNSSDRVKKRLRGEDVDRPPNFDIFMTFAAHYIKQPLSKYYLDYRVLVDANMAMVENFEADLFQAISDPYREAFDFGAQIEFPQDGLPVSVKPLVDTPEKLKTLTKPDPSCGKRMSDRLEAIHLMQEKSAGTIPVMGWVEGALAEAVDLRGMTNIMMDIYERPEWLKEFLEFIVEVEIDFARAQVDAGADIIGLGDAVASQISPEMYSEFALPYEQRIFEAVKNMGAIARLHICGNTSAIVPLMVESYADIIDLDWMVDMRDASQRFHHKVSFCGNFDPVAVMLNGSEADVFSATVSCMKAGGNNCFSGAGCEIPDGTPVLNLLAQNRALKQKK
ncbi:MAG: uroporphyrinogen decarboxylase family protein [Calditrichae bacterium]|nr:uroporphyrinogen decarboxylase family protein [Calditrichia bacterium]